MGQYTLEAPSSRRQPLCCRVGTFAPTPRQALLSQLVGLLAGGFNLGEEWAGRERSAKEVDGLRVLLNCSNALLNKSRLLLEQFGPASLCLPNAIQQRTLKAAVVDRLAEPARNGWRKSVGSLIGGQLAPGSSGGASSIR